MSWITDIGQYKVQETHSVLEDEEKKRNPRQNSDDSKQEQKKREKMVCALALLQVEKMLERSTLLKKFAQEHNACELPNSETLEKARGYFKKH